MRVPVIHTTSEQFFAAWDAFKRERRCRLSNIFSSPAELRGTLATKHCLQATGEASLFLFIPRHGSFYDCLFLSGGEADFARDVERLLSPCPVDLPIRCSVTGHEPLASSLARDLEDAGFRPVKSLLRVQLKKPAPGVWAAMRAFAEEYRSCMGFAGPGDAEEVYELLAGEFDPIGDNLPEAPEIRENILQGQVSVLKLDGRIASLHYFKICNGISSGYFDLTRKEYRGGRGLAFALTVFEHDYFQSRGCTINRRYGWRDATNSRYLKSSRQTNSLPDGVVIHTLVYTPGTSRQLPGAEPLQGSGCHSVPLFP